MLLKNPSNLSRSVLVRFKRFVTLNFLRDPTNLNTVLKLHKISATNGFLPHRNLNQPNKFNNQECFFDIPFHKKLRKCKPPEKESHDYERMTCCSLATEYALVKKLLYQEPVIGEEKLSYCGKSRKWSHSKPFWAGPKKRRRLNIGGYAENVRILSHQRFSHAQAWIHFTQPSQHFSQRFNRYQTPSLYKNDEFFRQKFMKLSLDGC